MKKVTAVLFGAIVIAMLLSACDSAPATAATEQTYAERTLATAAETTTTTAETTTTTAETTTTTAETTAKNTTEDSEAVSPLPITSKAAYKVTKTTYHDGSDVIYETYIRTYDAHDNEIYTERVTDNGLSYTIIYAYEYNADGTVAKKYQDSADHYIVYEYNPDGTEHSLREYKNGELYYATVNEYNERGEWSCLLTSGDGENYSAILGKYIYEYDDNGRKIACKRCDYDTGDLEVAMTYEYDESGNLIRQTEEHLAIKNEYSDYAAYTVTNEMTYDENGNKLLFIYLRTSAEGTEAYYTREYSYDSENRMTELRSYNADGKLTAKDIYTYEYFE